MLRIEYFRSLSVRNCRATASPFFGPVQSQNFTRKICVMPSPPPETASSQTQSLNVSNSPNTVADFFHR